MQTDRDARMVDWLGRIGAASAQHLSERFDLSLPHTREDIAGLAAHALAREEARDARAL